MAGHDLRWMRLHQDPHPELKYSLDEGATQSAKRPVTRSACYRHYKKLTHTLQLQTTQSDYLF